MEELKPCPFCGEVMSPVIAEIMADGATKWWQAECYDCGASAVAAHTKVEAIAAWNTRQQPAQDVVDGEAIARTLYLGHVSEHGFPNGLPTWEELPEKHERLCGDVLTKIHWRGIAETAQAALSNQPVNDAYEKCAQIAENIAGRFRQKQQGRDDRTCLDQANGADFAAQAIRNAAKDTPSHD